MSTILPLNSATPLKVNPKFFRNRLLFSLIEICFIALETPQALVYISKAFLKTTEWSDAWSTYHELHNSTLAQEEVFRIHAQKDLDLQKDVIIPNAVQQQRLTIATLRASNNLLLDTVEQDNQALAKSIQDTVDFLRTWSRAGNDVPYQVSFTKAQQREFEIVYGLHKNDQAPLLGLLSESQILRTSLKEWIHYNEDYLANKTQGLTNLVPTVNVSLDHSLEIDHAVRQVVRASRDKLVAAFLTLRAHYAELYKALTLQLKNTRASLDAISQAYDRLVNFAIRVTSFASTIPIPSGKVFPTIKLTDFPPSDFFKPDFAGVPRLEMYLAEFDLFLLDINVSFDDLDDGIITEIYRILSNGTNAVVEKILNLASRTDYFPPAIQLGEVMLSPIQALDTLAALEENLALNVNVNVETEDPDLFVDIPPFDVPEIDVDSQAVNKFQSAVDLFFVQTPSFDIPPWVLRAMNVLNMLIFGSVGFFLNLGLRALFQILRYWGGSAIPTPVVEMRTNEEKLLEEKRSKTTATALLLTRVQILQFVSASPKYILSALVFACVMAVVISREVNQFHPLCIASLNGTALSQNTLSPLYMNRALQASQLELTRHNKDVHAFAQQECQREGIASSILWREQANRFSTMKQKSIVNEQHTNRIPKALNDTALCDVFEAKCGGLKVSKDSCLQKDGSAILSPCSIRPLVEVLRDPLKESLFNCSEVPVNYLQLNSTDVVDPQKFSKVTCTFESAVWSHYWISMYLLVSYILLHMCMRPLVVDGMRTVLRRFLGPQLFHLNITTDETGAFTQPEYDEVKERGAAIDEKLFYMTLWGYAKLFTCSILIIGWISLLVTLGDYNIIPEGL